MSEHPMTEAPKLTAHLLKELAANGETAIYLSPERVAALASLWEAVAGDPWEHNQECAFNEPYRDEPAPCNCGVAAVATALTKLEELS